MNRYVVIFLSIQALQPPDRWFGEDKVKHFFLGSFIQSAGFGVSRSVGLSRTPSLIAASVMTGAAVAAKEMRDRNGHGTPSVKDAVWGLVGAAAVTPALLKTR